MHVKNNYTTLLKSDTNVQLLKKKTETSTTRD